VVTADPAHCRCAAAQAAWFEETGARIVLPVAYAHNEHIWNQYTLRLLGEGRRDAFKQFLTDRKIGCEIYYPVTMDRQACFADTPETSRRGCEVAHRLSGEAISLPIYPELTHGQKDEVIAAVTAFLEQG
jgi:dTDP-4-amino-4,6-dideoxygalactose transaminase